MKPIAVLLELETTNHTLDRSFAELVADYTLSVTIDEVRDDADPQRTAERIVDCVRAHAALAGTRGYHPVTVAVRADRTWRDAVGPEVQGSVVELLAGAGFRFVELGAERSDPSFRQLMDDPLAEAPGWPAAA